ncbi:MAG: hypothetical protein COA58_03900 [Bacteroidetes bacterium]|nr:MAG: hypothetical protein COA58_03900 [Bacteroidota bacterium]
MKLIISCFLITLTFISFAQKPKGNRIMAWQVDQAENGNYDSAFLYAKVSCMESIHLAVNWSSMDTNSGNFDQGFISGILDVSNIYYPAFNVMIELQLATINTVAKETPKDLMSTPFNHPTMISRFKQTLDTLFIHIPDVKLAALNIGNEHDVYMGTNAVQYAEYKTFLDSVVPYAKQLYFNLHGEELKVGTTFTLHSLVDENLKALCQSVNNGLDIVSTTYYPLENDFTMSPTSVVATDFSDLVAQYTDTTQPIYFAECGYASSDSCNSSEAQQADFYTKVFDAWDTHSSNIKYLTIFKSTDWSAADVQIFKDYYGISDIKFLEYLRTLGVRTWDGSGSNKLAYETIKCELNKRNWCGIDCKLSSILPDQKVDALVYPNPTNELLNVKTKDFHSLELYHTTGKLLLQSSNNSIDVSFMNAGIYHLIITLGNGMRIHKSVQIH